ncbi:HAMP domain-containing histidine kinase [Spirulina subsalsa FACHB-351]|uniref:histidine kinase n=1 Tax=Spirulina subsalsa FACHB-351 TaxID=234711 RepID=A0ABT3L6S1_9CYAN|nr:HAMP domain-containing sensor histidine kinase [Spirulina subsalsa]MCW6037205.1 HAMP domain-containing histidine kinase [Spirulina subsalsa FACHB-351]
MSDHALYQHQLLLPPDLVRAPSNSSLTQRTIKATEDPSDPQLCIVQHNSAQDKIIHLKDRVKNETLTESQAKEYSLLAALPDLIIRVDQHGTILNYFPPASTPTLEQEYLGQHISALWSEDIVIYTTYHIERAINSQSVQTGEYVLQEQEEWFYYKTQYVPYGENEVLMVIRDVSEDKRLEADLRVAQVKERQNAQELKKTLDHLQQTQAQLIQAEKMSALGTMVAGIAHELNNPVCFIQGNLQYALEYITHLLHLVQLYQAHETEPHPDITQYCEQIELDFLQEDLPRLFLSMQSGTEKISQIIQSLLNFSRLQQSDKKTIDLHEGLDSTLVILEHRCKAKNGQPAIKIIKNYGNITPVDCYAGLLNQVFMNLISNAIDALRQKDAETAQNLRKTSKTQDLKITITTEQTASAVRVRIKDNGVGIPEHIRDKIFNPFFTTKSVGHGTGLGLSLSYAIVVERHQGLLTMTSEVGTGTEFCVEIPTYAASFTALSA